jgi:HEAT repeat protein
MKWTVSGRIQSLIEALGNKDPEVRARIAEALGQLGRDAVGAVPALTRALQDPDDGVRAAAQKAIRQISDP